MKKEQEQERFKGMEERLQEMQPLISDWKAKHTDVYCICTFDEKFGFMRRPTRQEIAVAESQSGTDYMRRDTLIANTIWLGGDEEILTDDRYFITLQQHLMKLLELKYVELVKL